MMSISDEISDLFRNHGCASRTVKLGSTDTTASKFVHSFKLSLVGEDSFLGMYRTRVHMLSVHRYFTYYHAIPGEPLGFP